MCERTISFPAVCLFSFSLCPPCPLFYYIPHFRVLSTSFSFWAIHPWPSIGTHESFSPTFHWPVVSCEDYSLPFEVPTLSRLQHQLSAIRKARGYDITSRVMSHRTRESGTPPCCAAQRGLNQIIPFPHPNSHGNELCQAEFLSQMEKVIKLIN